MSKISILEPRSYQKPLIKTHVRHLAETGKALLCMATATGKTLTSGFIYQSLLAQRLLEKEDRILFLCHSVDILLHAEDEFRKLFPGLKTGMVTGDEKRSLDAQMVFSTFQSSDYLLPDAFALVIVDESHHSQAPSFKEDILRFTPKYLLGMTATPDRADGEDIREIFGEEPVSYTLAQAIVEEQVCRVNYQLLTIDLAQDELKRIQQELNAGVRLTRSQIERRLFSATQSEAFIDAINAYQGKKIVFCESIAEAERLAKHLDTAMSYHSELSLRDRKVVFEWFTTGLLTTITVVDAFNEGINIPDANHLVFLRSTQSKTVFLQQLGRGLRKIEGKESVDVHDFVGNLTRLQDLIELGREIREHRATHCGERNEGREEDEGDSSLFSLENFSFDISEETVDLIRVLHLIERNFLPFAEARALVRQQGWKSNGEYKSRYREFPGLPASPNKAYASTGWVNWPDFLGTETAPHQNSKDFLPFAEARALVQRQGWKSSAEYKSGYRQFPGLPSDPSGVYSYAGWVNWPDYLGTETTPPQNPEDLLPFTEARVLVRQQGWKSLVEYLERYRQFPGLPASPNKAYASTGWVNWPDFLGTETAPHQNSKDFLPFAEARALVQQQSWRSRREYKSGYQHFSGLPSDPSRTYASTGWVNWPDFLGTETAPHQNSKDFLPFAEARALVQRQGWKSSAEYRSGYRQFPGLPASPNKAYASTGWVNMPDYLGTKRTPRQGPKDFLPFAEARVLVRQQGWKSLVEYLERYRQFPGLPSNPNKIYASTGWVNMPDYLGIVTRQNPKDLFFPFAEARSLMRQQEWKSRREYKSKYRQFPGLPASPNQAYASEGWISWSHFLGKVKG